MSMIIRTEQREFLCYKLYNERTRRTPEYGLVLDPPMLRFLSRHWQFWSKKVWYIESCPSCEKRRRVYPIAGIGKGWCNVCHEEIRIPPEKWLHCFEMEI